MMIAHPLPPRLLAGPSLPPSEHTVEIDEESPLWGDDPPPETASSRHRVANRSTKPAEYRYDSPTCRFYNIHFAHARRRQCGASFEAFPYKPFGPRTAAQLKLTIRLRIRLRRLPPREVPVLDADGKPFWTLPWNDSAWERFIIEAKAQADMWNNRFWLLPPPTFHWIECNPNYTAATGPHAAAEGIATAFCRSHLRGRQCDHSLADASKIPDPPTLMRRSYGHAR